MRETMLHTLGDVRGKRILDAGCGAGQMTHELALRGAEVVAVDISPSLVEIARKRLPDALSHQVTFHAGDMLDSALGDFDHVVAMDSLIYYDAADINRSISTLFQRTSCKIVFTVAPRTPFLMAFFGMGKLFPRRDRSPVMIPHAPKKLARLVAGNLRSVARISSGFYISECLEVTKLAKRSAYQNGAHLRRPRLRVFPSDSFCGCRCSKCLSAWPLSCCWEL